MFPVVKEIRKKAVGGPVFLGHNVYTALIESYLHRHCTQPGHRQLTVHKYR